MAYASGKKALAICDRCGFRYKLLQLRQEWNGLKVCPNCFETKHPQLETSNAPADAQSLYRPRPDTDKEVGQGFVISNNDNIISSSIAGFRVEGAVGEVTISGVSAASPTPSPTPAPTPAPSITTYTVTVASYYGSNYFYINGSRQATLNLSEGSTYRFDQSDSSNSGHPLRFSTTSNGTHGGGSEYTTGVTTAGTPGSSGAYTQIEVASGAPTLYYYCTNHSGMGGTINTT